MRIIFLTVLLVCLLMNQVAAITPINNAVIRDAQEYGRANAELSFSEFLMPWVAYEEKAVKLNDTEERSYLYTPFVLLAIDARGKTLNHKSFSVNDSESVLKDYAGSLVFSVILYGDKPTFTKNTTAVLKQDNTIIRPYHSIIPKQAVKILSDEKDPIYNAQCYYYFREKDVLADVSAVLQVNMNKKRIKKFYFNFAKIK